MIRRGNLGRDEHLRLFLHLGEPDEGRFAVTFKATWLGTGLPHTGTEVMATLHGQLAGCVHHLLLSLCTAGTCNDEGAFVVTRKIQFL